VLVGALLVLASALLVLVSVLLELVSALPVLVNALLVFASASLLHVRPVLVSDLSMPCFAWLVLASALLHPHAKCNFPLAHPRLFCPPPPPYRL
jgi:hypothetical protein